jgi:uncharacterized membrane protein YcjF (UPF0283 family)
VSGDPALRAEHDRLAARLEVRSSIDHARRAAYGAFFSFVLGGLAVKLAWDRWVSVKVTRFKGPPIFFFASAAVALAVVAFTVWSWLRFRRLAAVEDLEFARLRDLRGKLGLDR